MINRDSLRPGSSPVRGKPLLGHPCILCGRPCGLAFPIGALSREQEDDRAEITGSCKGEKPRSSDEKMTIFRHQWAGPPGAAALSSGRASLPVVFYCTFQLFDIFIIFSDYIWPKNSY
jgi:hypothetical protein